MLIKRFRDDIRDALLTSMKSFLETHNIEKINIYLLVNKSYMKDFTYHRKLLLKMEFLYYEDNVFVGKVPQIPMWIRKTN